MVFQVMLFGCETWTLRKADKRKIDVLELWSWKRLLRIPCNSKNNEWISDQ
jgi:hypothetical protein